MDYQAKLYVNGDTVDIDNKERRITLECVITNAPKLSEKILNEIEGATIEHLGSTTRCDEPANSYRLVVEGGTADDLALVLRGGAVQNYIRAKLQGDRRKIRQLRTTIDDLYTS